MKIRAKISEMLTVSEKKFRGFLSIFGIVKDAF